ncbi:MAG: hypothetical protein O3A00_00460 [Planctomycetota bacterium]|nr:hypothetical protein [Planctomycetota bacterium]
MFERRGLLLALIAGSGLVGCSDESAVELVPVSGKITFNGQPLAKANVTFVPESKAEFAPTSSGTTDAAGVYKLEAPLGSGAMPGKHRVKISKYSEGSADAGDAGGEPENEIPAKYNLDTELTIELSAEGTDKADFNLVN